MRVVVVATTMADITLLRRPRPREVVYRRGSRVVGRLVVGRRGRRTEMGVADMVVVVVTEAEAMAEEAAAGMVVEPHRGSNNNTEICHLHRLAMKHRHRRHHLRLRRYAGKSGWDKASSHCTVPEHHRDVACAENERRHSSICMRFWKGIFWNACVGIELQ